MLVPLADADIDQVRRIHTKHGGSLEAADALPAAAQKPGDHAENDEAKRVDDGKAADRDRLYRRRDCQHHQDVEYVRADHISEGESVLPLARRHDRRHELRKGCAERHYRKPNQSLAQSE